LILQFTDQQETKDYLPTIGVDCKTKSIDFMGHTVVLQFWDIAGEAKYKPSFGSIMRGTHGIIFVFDVTNPTSLNNIKNWKKEITDSITPAAMECISFVLVGNKVDIVDRKVSQQDAEDIAKELGDHEYFEASAVTGKGIKEAIEELVEECEMNDKKSTYEKEIQENSTCCWPFALSKSRKTTDQERLLTTQ